MQRYLFKSLFYIESDKILVITDDLSAFYLI